MKPHDDYRNGDGVGPAGAAGAGEDSEDEETSALEDELSLRDDAAPARVLAALNALRKSRQHYDTLLVAGGAELPAHRAVLAAASPYLLRALAGVPDAAVAPAAVPAASAAPVFRVDDVDADALRELLDYAYTGRLRVRDAAAARRLYCAAWRLRLDAVRTHLAHVLLRRLTPHDCLELRALPDLAPDQLATLDAYIAQNFDEVCKSGALATLPLIRIEMMRETSSEGGEETAFAVAEAALAWLRDQQADDVDLDELCSRTHLLYVDGRGALRDCGELPAARGDAPELQEYRREAAERGRASRRAASAAPVAPAARAQQLGARTPRGTCAVLAATRAAPARTTRALLALRGRLAAARVAWRDVRGGGAGVARGGPLGGVREPDAERRARLAHGRAAHGTAVLGGRLLVCGGYDRARVLRAAEAYDPLTNEWSALADMRGARARFPAAVLGDALFALGGSDGHAELQSVAALRGGVWGGAAPLPLALSHAAAAAVPERAELYVLGGWAAGHNLKRVLRYSPADDAWTEAPPLNAGRSQCAAAYWQGALWVLGGCDAWHCLASTETLRLGADAWRAGPALPTARRSMGAAAWRGLLVSAGGSDGAASLRRTEWLAAPDAAWRAGPDLRRPRAALGLAVLRDALYAVGGFDGKEFLECVECLYEPDGEWTTLLAPPAPRAALEPTEPVASEGPNTPDGQVAPDATDAPDGTIAPDGSEAPAAPPHERPAAAAARSQ